MKQWKAILACRFYGVCEWWGQKLGLPSINIRKFFIYFSFLTLGSPIILYLVMAFILENKEALKGKRKVNIWEL